MTMDAIIEDYYKLYVGDKAPVAKPAMYFELYRKYFAELFDREIVILELGIFDGHSLETFSRMFPKARVIGVDMTRCERSFSSDRVRMYQGLQDDPELFQRIMAENGIHRFDIIIDDCSHVGSLTLNSFKILYPHLAPGGLYVIEDWGAGYFPKYAGGVAFNPRNHLVCRQRVPQPVLALANRILGRIPIRLKTWREWFPSHLYGIPGMIKQLVDEVAMPDITGHLGTGGNVASRLDYLHVYNGITFMQKPAA